MAFTFGMSGVYTLPAFSPPVCLLGHWTPHPPHDFPPVSGEGEDLRSHLPQCCCPLPSWCCIGLCSKELRLRRATPMIFYNMYLGNRELNESCS